MFCVILFQVNRTNACMLGVYKNWEWGEGKDLCDTCSRIKIPFRNTVNFLTVNELEQDMKD